MEKVYNLYLISNQFCIRWLPIEKPCFTIFSSLRYFLTKAAYYYLLSDNNINKTIESNQLSLEIEHNNKQHKKDNTSDSD